MADIEDLALISTESCDEKAQKAAVFSTRRLERPFEDEPSSAGYDNETPSIGATESWSSSETLSPSSSTTNNTMARRIAQDYPRFTLLVCRILLPYFTLLLVSLIGGTCLSVLESSNETAHNNAVASELLQRKLQLEDIANVDVLNDCVNKFKLVDVDNLFKDVNPLLLYQEHVKLCTHTFQNIQQERIQIELTPVFRSQAKEQMRFDWTTCNAESFHNEWNDQYAESILSMRSFTNNYTSFLGEAQQLAVQAATGKGACSSRGNIAKGAKVWFHFSTTIGNPTKVSTAGGRALLYTLGSLSMVMCLLMVLQAGLVLRQCFFGNNDFLSKPQSMILLFGAAFWGLVAFYGWWLQQQQQYNETISSMKDSLWVAYNTLMTLKTEDNGPGGLLVSTSVVFLGLTMLGNVLNTCWDSYWGHFGNQQEQACKRGTHSSATN